MNPQTETTLLHQIPGKVEIRATVYRIFYASHGRLGIRINTTAGSLHIIKLACAGSLGQTLMQP